jgi:hypothetical protein
MERDREATINKITISTIFAIMRHRNRSAPQVQLDSLQRVSNATAMVARKRTESTGYPGQLLPLCVVYLIHDHMYCSNVLLTIALIAETSIAYGKGPPTTRFPNLSTHRARLIG